MTSTKPTYLNNVTAGKTPDLSRGSCMDEYGRELLDKAGAVMIKDRMKWIRAARRLCEGCLVLVECKTWVGRESSPGAWGGFLAGQTAAERSALGGEQAK